MSILQNINPARFSEIVANSTLNDGFVPQKYKESLRVERGEEKLIVVAAAPKSGSTFLSGSLCKITGYDHFRLTEGYATNEHDLYLPSLLMMNNKGCISQLHIKGTYHNIALMQLFEIAPIILVRKIEDIVISLAKDLRKKQDLEDWEIGKNGYSFIWQDLSTKDLTDDELTDMVIELAVPWYVNFYVSWYRLSQKGIVKSLWLTYEEMMENKEKALIHVMNFLGYKEISSIDSELLDKKYGTFRTGGTGEGEKTLTKSQKLKIREKFSFYKNIDFSMYGLV